jgi:hypothetical protein
LLRVSTRLPEISLLIQEKEGAANRNVKTPAVKASMMILRESYQFAIEQFSRGAPD